MESNVRESVAKARQAVALDVTDGNSWCKISQLHHTKATPPYPMLMQW